MIQQTMFCDRCGREIKDPSRSVHVNILFNGENRLLDFDVSCAKDAANDVLKYAFGNDNLVEVKISGFFLRKAMNNSFRDIDTDASSAEAAYHILLGK